MTLTDVGTTGAWSKARPSGQHVAVTGPRPITLTGRTVAKPRRISLNAAAPPALASVVARLNALLSLPPDWDSYGASQVDVECAYAAAVLFTRLPPNPQPSISPTPDGGVEMEWAQGEVLLVLVVNGPLSQPMAKVLFDWGSGYEEWSTVADDDDRLEAAMRKVMESH